MSNNSLVGEHRESFFDRYAIVIGACLAILNSGMVIVAFGVFFKPVSTQFAWSRAETSGAFSLATIMSGLVGLAAGRLGDRFNPRLVIIICGVLQGIAYMLLSQMHSLWQLYFYYGILVGAGMSNVVPSTSIVAKHYGKQRGLMSGIAMAGAPLGSALAPPLATLLINRYDWSLSYLVFGGLALIFMLFCAICLFHSSRAKTQNLENIPGQRTPGLSLAGRDGAGSPQPKVEGLSLPQVMRNWPFWCLGLALFCAYFSQQDLIVHIVPHALDIGISAGYAALILTVINIFNIFGNYLTGIAVDKIGSRISLVITMSFLFVSSMLLIIAGSLWVLLIFGILFGIAWGGTSTLRSTMIAELFGIRFHGAIMGAIFFISVVGGTISPILTGYIFDITGRYEAAFIIISALALFGLVLALVLRRSSKFRPSSMIKIP